MSALRVLVVDDNPGGRAILTTAIQARAAEVTTVQDGWEAIEAYGFRKFDLILMDLNMPVMDGLEATRSIRAMETKTGRKRVPVIVISGRGREWDVAEAKGAGADLHLLKPLSVEALLRAIDVLVPSAR